MKLNLKALTLTAGLLWGGAILFVSLLNLMSPDYGRAFLETVASVYPGYEPFGGVESVVIGSLIGFVDGAIAGAIFGWLYNLLSR